VASAARVADLPLPRFLDILAALKIPVVEGDATDLQDDLAAAHRPPCRSTSTTPRPTALSSALASQLVDRRNDIRTSVMGLGEVAIQVSPGRKGVQVNPHRPAPGKANRSATGLRSSSSLRRSSPA